MSAGSALLVAIFLEVMGRMVLLIPAAWKKIKDQGIKEGRAEGRAEERQRILDAVEQLGDQVPPEILDILRGESDRRG